MEPRDQMIIAQSTSAHAAQIVSGMHIDNVLDATEAFATVYEFVHTTVLGKIAEHALSQEFPGAQAVPPAEGGWYQQASQPPPQPQAQPQTGPGPTPGLAPVTQFPGTGNWGGPVAQPPAPAPMPTPAAWNPAAAVYQGGAPASVQSSSPEEQLWIEYFNDPSQWYDNREGKKNSKAPDFRHKQRKDNSGYNVGLWLGRAPEWVKQRFGVA